MTRLLYINSSVRTSGSISRELSADFVRQWHSTHPDGVVVERDLATTPVPHLTEATVEAFFTPAEQRSPEQVERVGPSDELVDELLAADLIVIATPMYNFSVPSVLKAWIDHVARAGRTFEYTENGPVGLVDSGKKVVVFTARGGVYSQGPARSMDFHATYLRGVLGFLGLTDVEFVHTEGLSMGEEKAEEAIAGSRAAIGELLAA